MIKRLKYLLLYVRDVTASVAFYEQVLGLRLVSRQHDRDGDVAFMELSDMELILHGDRQVACSTDLSARGAGVIFEFDVDDIDDTYQRIRSHCPIDQPRDMPFGLRQLYLKDPDGYVLCLSSSAAASHE